jgi:PAS domain S-box-containing protein
MHDQSDIAARHLAKVVESSDDAIVSKDLNSTIISWNRAAERMFGYSAEEAIGRSIRMLIPADLQGEEDDVLARIRAGETVDHYETIRMRKDGQLLAISLTVSPIRSESGEIIGASKIARDISERTRLEAAAREHAAITEKLAEVGAVVTSTLDREIIVQKVTDTATQLTHAEFGAFFYNVRDPESGDAYMLYTLSGAPTGAYAKQPDPRATEIFGPTFRGEGIVRLDDVTEDPRYGQSSPYFGMPPDHLPVRSYLAVPVKGVSGDVLGVLFFGHSSPGVFTLQHERLAQGVASWASVALENARLYVEAHTANRMKDEFLAVLSHELRTPLNAILGYARLLRGGILSGEKAARGLETLERNATWLTQIVEDVLDVSRIVSGKIRLNIQRVELALIVDNAAATIQPAADAKGVRVETVIDPRVRPVSVDADRMQQVVWNLLSNAVKFTPEGGTVRIELNPKDSSTELVVEDTGAGIRADFLPHVFERFRQGEAGTTRKTGGLGLGLAIVRHIVEMHGGTVKAESAGEGKGARFSIELPRAPVQRPPADAQRERAAVIERSSLTQLGDLTGVRVLAIDDEVDALTLLRVVLESAGAEVTSLDSCVAALDQIGSLRPQVVVVDVSMPVMDGFDFIARIRRSTDPEIRNVPAAAVTAFARSEDRTKALRSGFDVHLSKPVDPGELVATVGMLARRASRPAQRT